MWLCMGKKRNSKRMQGNPPLTPRAKSSSPDPPPLPHPARHAGFLRAATSSNSSRASSTSTPPITPRQLRQADGHSADSLSLRDISELDTPNLSTRSSEPRTPNKVCKVFNTDFKELPDDDDDDLEDKHIVAEVIESLDEPVLERGSSKTLYDTSKSETNLLSAVENPKQTGKTEPMKQVEKKNYSERKPPSLTVTVADNNLDDIETHPDTSFTFSSALNKSSGETQDTPKSSINSTTKQQQSKGNANTSLDNNKSNLTSKDSKRSTSGSKATQHTPHTSPDQSRKRDLKAENSQVLNEKQESKTIKPMTFKIYSPSSTSDKEFNFKVSTPKSNSDSQQKLTESDKTTKDQELYDVRQQIVPDSEDEDLGSDLRAELYLTNGRSRRRDEGTVGRQTPGDVSKSRSFSMDNIYPPTLSRHGSASGRGPQRNHSQEPADSLVRNASTRFIAKDDQDQSNPLANLDFLTQDLIAIANSLGSYSAAKPSQKADGTFDSEGDAPTLEQFTSIRLNILKATSRLLNFVNGILSNPRGTFDLDTISLLCMQLKTNLHELENFVLDLLRYAFHDDMDQLEKRIRKQLRFMKEVNSGISRYLESIEKTHESSGSKDELNKEENGSSDKGEGNVKLGNVVLLTRGIPLIVRTLASFVTKLLEPPAATPSANSSTDERMIAVMDDTLSDGERIPADGMTSNNGQISRNSASKDSSKLNRSIQQSNPVPRPRVASISSKTSDSNNQDLRKKAQTSNSLRVRTSKRSVSAERSSEREMMESGTLERNKRNRSVDVLGQNDPILNDPIYTLDAKSASFNNSIPCFVIDDDLKPSSTIFDLQSSSSTKFYDEELREFNKVSDLLQEKDKLEKSQNNIKREEAIDLVAPPRRRNVVSGNTAENNEIIESNNSDIKISADISSRNKKNNENSMLNNGRKVLDDKVVQGINTRAHTQLSQKNSGDFKATTDPQSSYSIANPHNGFSQNFTEIGQLSRPNASPIEEGKEREGNGVNIQPAVKKESTIKIQNYRSPSSPSDYDNPRSPASPGISRAEIFPSPRLKKKQIQTQQTEAYDSIKPPALPPKTKNYEKFKTDSAFDHDPMYLLGQSLLDQKPLASSNQMNNGPHSSSQGSPVVLLSTSPQIRRASFGEKIRSQGAQKTNEVNKISNTGIDRQKSGKSDKDQGFTFSSNRVIHPSTGTSALENRDRMSSSNQSNPQQAFNPSGQFSQQVTTKRSISNSQNFVSSSPHSTSSSAVSSPHTKQLSSKSLLSPEEQNQQQMTPLTPTLSRSSNHQQQLYSPQQSKQQINQQVLQMTERLGSDQWISTTDLNSAEPNTGVITSSFLKELEDLKRQADNFPVSSHIDIIGGLERYPGIPSATLPRSSERKMEVKIRRDYHDINDNITKKSISPVSSLSPRHSVHFHPTEQFENARVKDYHFNAHTFSSMPHTSLQPQEAPIFRSGSEYMMQSLGDFEMTPAQHEEDARLFLFYCDQISQHWTVIDSAASSFFRCVDRNQPPKLFIAHCQYVLLAGRKMSQLGDLLVSSMHSDDKRHWVESYSNRLCDALKTAARATKDAAVNYPSGEHQKLMLEGVRDVTDWALDLKDMVFRLAYLSRSAHMSSAGL